MSRVCSKSLFLRRGNCTHVDRHGVFEGTLIKGALTRNQRVFNELLRAVENLRLGEMDRELGGVPIDRVALQRLQRFRDAGMEPRPLGQRQLFSQGLLDQLVAEPVVAEGVG